MGSQATGGLRRSPDLNSEGAAGPLRASVSGFLTTGTRTRTEVSERLSGRSEMVCVCSADPAAPAARSALAERLMALAMPVCL